MSVQSCRRFARKRARYSNTEIEGVWFDVWLPSSEQRKFAAAELSAAFRGRSSSAFFETKAQRGSIELVSKTNASATIAVDLEMDTGATVKGRFMASSCAETAFVRPFGGLECVETRADCDGGANVRCADDRVVHLWWSSEDRVMHGYRSLLAVSVSDEVRLRGRGAHDSLLYVGGDRRLSVRPAALRSNEARLPSLARATGSEADHSRVERLDCEQLAAERARGLDVLLST